jgi:hypothetical protein
MIIIQGEDQEWQRGLEHRGGTYHYRRLLEGTPGSIDNFQFSMGRMTGDFYSPRHRHNFEQLRFTVDGGLNFSRDGKTSKGFLSYFPEGTFYGPQTQKEGEFSLGATLQFGGASGSGYLSRKQVKEGMAALSSEGEFKDGVFRRFPGKPGKKNMDGYQAIWEHVNGRPMLYPKPRYSRPFMMDPAAYAWVPTSEGGVAERLLGVFTERQCRASFLKISPDAGHRATGRAIYFVISGSGRAGNETLRKFTTVFLDHGESLKLVAQDEVELMRLGMPDLTALQPILAAAAE